MVSRPPLDGVLVLELANFMAGPYCGMLLADLGAQVIKVENPRGGDLTRTTPPFERGHSAGFLRLNRNKKSLTLNLKDERGREIFLRLADRADVLVENFRPGTTRDLGVDYETLSRRNAGLVYVAASGFGQTGPYSQRAALDLIIQGMSGLMSITGEPDRPPVKVGVPIVDLAAATHGALAAVAALLARERTRAGQLVDVSMFEVGLSLAVWETSAYFATGEVPRPLGSAHRNGAPYQAVRTADGYVTIGATTPRNWAAFCRVLGLDDLIEDQRFATMADRRGRYRELAAIVEEITATKPSTHWYAALEEAGVPCGILNDIGQVLSDPHLAARGTVVSLPHPELGEVPVVGPPIRLSATPTVMAHAGPMLGQHTDEVLEWLGVLADERASLRRDGVI